MHGLVISGSNNAFDVECDDGIVRICTLKGKKLKTTKDYYNPLCPGDIVIIEEDALTEKSGQIVDLVPRKNEYVRWNIKRRAPQLLASNLDHILCVCTPSEPPFRPRFIDRTLAQAEYQHIEPIIICNKWDLVDAKDPDIEYHLTIWEDLGYTIFRISAKSNEGMSELAKFLENKFCALMGQSGVGKTTIINKLDPSCALKTGSLSEKYGRGTHTTTKGKLIHLKLNEALLEGRCGVTADIIDTPGIRRFILHEIEACDLALYFKEFVPLLGTCTYGMSCSHNREPGCKILEATHAGVISEERYESWKRIKEEIETSSWSD
ncbi:MAG TPA: ribosome small subunit-dependent GTPase A [Treponemataceae bacterium]|nr:ribosome small subunit-dependent GTPase A [Treponemataceae bacterium]